MVPSLALFSSFIKGVGTTEYYLFGVVEGTYSKVINNSPTHKDILFPS